MIHRLSPTLHCLLALSFLGPVAAAQTPTPSPAISPPEIVGTWYLRMQTAVDARIRFLGSIHIRTTTHLLIKISSGPEGYAQHQKTCIVDSRPSRNITKTTLPEAFISHLAQKTYPITLSANPDGSWEYTADLQQQFVGYDGKRSPNAIPESRKHPAVYDWDEDGEPGATVIVDVPILGDVRLFLVQTNHTILKGTFAPPGRVSGTAHQRLMAQQTIGADNLLLAGSPRLTIGSGHNGFEMVSITADADCAEIKRLAGDSF